MHHPTLMMETLEPRCLLDGSVGVNDLTVQNTSVSSPAVVAHLFYNNSRFDGYDAQANARDDAAIATDKQALRPGQTATFANYSSYHRGINGLMFDVPEVAVVPTKNAFLFKVGNSSNPAGWSVYTGDVTITVRQGAGVEGRDRVTIVFPDHAIQKTWLEVTLFADPWGQHLGLWQDEVFYFGNAIGETGNSTGNTNVDATDELAARNNQRHFLHPATVTDRHDFNRDARVDATDELIARAHQTTFQTRLTLLSIPLLTIPTDPLSNRFTVQVDGRFLPVYTYQDMDYVSVPWNEPVTLTVTRLDGNNITTKRIRPERLNLPGTVTGPKLTFTLSTPQHLVVSIDKLRKLVIVPRQPDPDRPNLYSSTVINARTLGADPTGTLDNTTILQNAINNLPTGGTLYVPAGVYVTGSLKLKSNMTLYLEHGAMLKGSSDPYKHLFHSNTLYFIYARDVQNVRILGHGTLDANGDAIRRAWERIKNVDKVAGRTFLSVNADDMTIKNITVRESYSWNMHFVSSDRLHVSGVKVFSNMNHGNGDGMDIDGCVDVLIENCLIIAEDDAISPKAAWTTTSPKNLTVRNSVLWSQNATGIRLGDETFSSSFDNMLFENIDILRANTMIRIYNYDGADMRNITFSNLWTEEFSLYVQNQGYEEIKRQTAVSGETYFFYIYVRPRTTGSPIGLVRDVLLHNVYAQRKVQSRLEGLIRADGSTSIRRVTFHNYFIKGICYDNADDLDIAVRGASEQPTIICD